MPVKTLGVAAAGAAGVEAVEDLSAAEDLSVSAAGAGVACCCGTAVVAELTLEIAIK